VAKQASLNARRRLTSDELQKPARHVVELLLNGNAAVLAIRKRTARLERTKHARSPPPDTSSAIYEQ
jgi:hypothetical protein